MAPLSTSAQTLLQAAFTQRDWAIRLLKSLLDSLAEMPEHAHTVHPAEFDELLNVPLFRKGTRAVTLGHNLTPEWFAFD